MLNPVFLIILIERVCGYRSPDSLFGYAIIPFWIGTKHSSIIVVGTEARTSLVLVAPSLKTSGDRALAVGHTF